MDLVMFWIIYIGVWFIFSVSFSVVSRTNWLDNPGRGTKEDVYIIAILSLVWPAIVVLIPPFIVVFVMLQIVYYLSMYIEQSINKDEE